ncbi:MAG: acetate/propionate family kinase [Bacteroidota bacterium]|nr:acetate/propionate family kinase [Bacteroidota bacterium]
MRVLTINSGSSSIKFAYYEWNGSLTPLFKDEITIGQDAGQTINGLIAGLEKRDGLSSLGAIGHRITYGAGCREPARITPELLQELKQISGSDPEHRQGELALIEEFRRRLPGLPQIACVDTSMDASIPDAAKRLPIPRRYNAMGIKRYGFHGLSYSYLLDELRRISGRGAANGRLILAHLGHGASVAAVKNGDPMDTSMGFTPTSGLVMGSRTGDPDPEVAWYLVQAEGISPQQFNHLINHESCLLGVSGKGSDMRDLILSQNKDPRTAEPIERFAYQAKKWIGSFAAVLGGLDTLVFSGGIGENAPEVRELICQGLQFLGIELDARRNTANLAIVSSEKSRVSVQVIPTNEELIIAESVCDFLNHVDKN